MEALLQFAGRLHIMLLHAPIGLLIGLASLELFMLVRGRAIPRDVRSLLAWIVAMAAAASVGSGLLLSEEGGPNADIMDLHKWLGIASGVGALLAAVIQQAGKMRAYAAVLALTCGLIIPTGHFGASMTHGEDFLTEPFAPKTPLSTTLPNAPASQVVTPGGPRSNVPGPASSEGETPARATESTTVYVSIVAPIFKATCISCHGAERQKGKLRLDTPEHIMAGGRSGPAVIAGDAPGSDLYRRMQVEIDHDDHMPPSSKPQPSDADIKAIEQWITAGASFTAIADATPRPGESTQAARGPGSGVRVPETPIANSGTRLPDPGPRNPEPGTPVPEPATAELPPPPPPHASAPALAAIRAVFVHVEPVSRDSSKLVIDSSAVARSIDDAAARSLLEPVLEQTSDLTLARTKITDATLSLMSRMPQLRRLNISSTSVTGAGIAMLASHPTLEELIVSGCALSDHVTESIEKMPSLKRVYVWKSGISADAIAALRVKRVTLLVDAGDTAPAIALEKDEPIKPIAATPTPAVAAPPLSDPTAEAAAIAAAKAEALRPVNTACPVSGKPVDAGFAIVYKGRVVGFCCRHCLGQFLEAPEKFEASVK